MRDALALPAGVGPVVDMSPRSMSAKPVWLSKSSMTVVLGQDTEEQITESFWIPTGATFAAAFGDPPMPTAAVACEDVFRRPRNPAKYVRIVRLTLTWML